MNSFQTRIEEFMVKGEQMPAGGYRNLAPEIRDGQLRAEIIMEEARETAEAMTGLPWRYECNPDGVAVPAKAPNLPESVDGCIDLLYVVLGALSNFGIDAEPYFRAVHDANLAKVKDGIIRRPDGKIIKPAGWKPPDIAAMVALDTKMRLTGGIAVPHGPFGDPGDDDDPLDWKKK